MKNTDAFSALYTPFEESMPDIPYMEYPRPQLVRDSYMCLNGRWELSVRAHDGTVKCKTDVLVPFPPESRLSGAQGYSHSDGDVLVYERRVMLPNGFFAADIQRLLLHFGACDQIARVFVNGTSVGEHIGGYLPFYFDISPYLKNGSIEIKVEVTDDLDLDIPYGKQRKKRGGMWYTPISGIWQTVWLESVPQRYIKGLRITPSLDSVTIEMLGGADGGTVVVDGRAYEFEGPSVKISPDEPHLWTPDDPFLYDFTITSGDDKVRSYFALRTVSVGRSNGTPCILFNGKPMLFHGLLDQGYFPDGIYLPATPEGFRNDITAMKGLGFNMLRKHIKIEPELFYYYCDLHGMIVFQDLVNNGKYSFLLDTALPTVFLRRGISHRATRRRRELFESCAHETLDALYNHPCICYYTLFNEGWGQYDADRLYSEMKAHDPTRVWDATSGWFKGRRSDVQSEHIYFKPVKLKPDGEHPLVLSEFGGYSCMVDGHIFNPSNNYGYKTFKTTDELTCAMQSLYFEQILPEIKQKGLCAVVLTQVSDVEDETNGLLTYDRQVIKVNEEAMRNVSDQLNRAFEEKMSE